MLPRLARVLKSGVLTSSRSLSYPQVPLTSPIPNLEAPVQSENTRQHIQKLERWNVAESKFPPTELTQLENGLRVASQEAFGQSSTVGVLVDAGSRYEVHYTSGVSHMLQRMVSTGTAKYPTREAMLSALDPIGGMFNCQRFRDVMMYTVNSLSHSVPEATEVLAETLWRPSLEQQELEAEKTGIRFELEEIHYGPNSEPYLEELIHQASYRSNTMGLPCICPEESIEKITREELLVYLASHFDPSRMVLVGVNVDHGQLVELAKQHFVGAETTWKEVKGRPIDNSLSQYTSSDVKIQRKGPPVVGPNPYPELIHVAIAMESCSYLEEDYFTYAVLNMYMGGGGSFSAGGPGKGMYTHLYLDVLTRNHWVYWAMSQIHAYKDSGIFCLQGSAHPSRARDLIQVLCQQFHHMTNIPDQSSLSRAKEMIKSSMMMNLESKAIVFEDIGRQVLGQGFKLSPEELSEKIDAVTAEDLQRTGKCLMESSPAIAALGDLSQVPSRTELEEALFKNKGVFRSKRSIFSFGQS